MSKVMRYVDDVEKYVDDESETTDVQLNESGGDDASDDAMLITMVQTSRRRKVASVECKSNKRYRKGSRAQTGRLISFVYFLRGDFPVNPGALLMYSRALETRIRGRE
jgi:hypothetical protein